MKHETQFEAVCGLCPDAKLLSEGGQTVVYLPAFRFEAKGVRRTMDLLLYPAAHSGYDTRLFFAEKIDEAKGNWNQFRVVDREWWAISWRGVAASLPWVTMLLAHLRAVA